MMVTIKMMQVIMLLIVCAVIIAYSIYSIFDKNQDYTHKMQQYIGRGFLALALFCALGNIIVF